jgi:DNA-binding LytR/AlgR family response regulator
MYEIAICDDCKADRELLKQWIKKNESYNKEIIICEYSSGKELLEAMNYVSFSAIFLDIQMGGMNGGDTARKIREIDHNLILVFYTGYAEPSPKIIEVQPYRYIMKNMSSSVMNNYISAILNKMQVSIKIPSVAAQIGRDLIFIKPEDIIYIEKYKKGTRIYLSKQALKLYHIAKGEDGQYPVIRTKDKLNVLYEMLKYYGFGCPHGSYIINLNYLSSCRSNILTLENVDLLFQITRSKAKEFNKLKSVFIRSKYVRGDNTYDT